MLIAAGRRLGRLDRQGRAAAGAQAADRPPDATVTDRRTSANPSSPWTPSARARGSSSSSSAAARPPDPVTEGTCPTDAAIVGILDSLEVDGEVTFRKLHDQPARSDGPRRDNPHHRNRQARMQRTREMLSVGIDVGTTTTQVVFSRLTVRNTARLGLVPRIEVDARAVEHVGAGAVHPAGSVRTEIDLDALMRVVNQEYAAAGIAPTRASRPVRSSSPARPRCAGTPTRSCSACPGSRVTSSSPSRARTWRRRSPARGSGAATWSAEHYTTVLNADIGGGSTNVAVFRAGRHLASSAIMVGGRGLQLETGIGQRHGDHPVGAAVLDHLGSTSGGRPAATCTSCGPSPTSWRS
jgi:hypothetical protein